MMTTTTITTKEITLDIVNRVNAHITTTFKVQIQVDVASRRITFLSVPRGSWELDDVIQYRNMLTDLIDSLSDGAGS